MVPVPSGHDHEEDMDRYTDVETETSGRDETDERILDLLRRDGTHSLDQLSVVLPEAGWSKVFLAVDRLSREGKVSVGSHNAETIKSPPHRSMGACVSQRNDEKNV
jgi:hypothetical protein